MDFITKRSRKMNALHIETLFSKYGQLLITAVGLYIGIWQLQKQQQFSNAMEFKRKLWDKKLETYNSLADITAKLSASIAKPAFDSIATLYQQTYLSATPLFNSESEQLMHLIDSKITDIRADAQDSDQKILRNNCYFLVKSCKSSLDSTFTEVTNH